MGFMMSLARNNCLGLHTQFDSHKVFGVQSFVDSRVFFGFHNWSGSLKRLGFQRPRGSQHDDVLKWLFGSQALCGFHPCIGSQLHNGFHRGLARNNLLVFMRTVTRTKVYGVQSFADSNYFSGFYNDGYGSNGILGFHYLT